MNSSKILWRISKIRGVRIFKIGTWVNHRKFYEKTTFKKAIEALASLKSEQGFGENHEYYLASL